MRSILLIPLVVLIASCDDHVPRCVPGATVACPCPESADGWQVCAPSALWSSCQCYRAEPPPDAAVGGFWCRDDASCYPDRSLCLRERSLLRDEGECTWQGRAFCFPNVWGLRCYPTNDLCVSTAERERTRESDVIPANERKPLGECRVHDYAW